LTELRCTVWCSTVYLCLSPKVGVSDYFKFLCSSCWRRVGGDETEWGLRLLCLEECCGSGL